MTIAKAYPTQNTALNDEHETVLSFFEELGFFLRRGIFDLLAVWEMYSYYIEHYWPLLEPHVAELRRSENDKTFYENAELLYRKSCAITEKRCLKSDKTPAQLSQFMAGESNLKIETL